MPTKAASPIPAGRPSVTPHIIVRDCAKAIEFYKLAFGATEIYRIPGSDGKSIVHAEIRVSGGIVMLCDEFPQMNALSPAALNGTPVTIHIYSENVDAFFDRAMKAGATALMSPMDMFWGDRFGKLQDPFGHQWSIATHQWDMTVDEMKAASVEAMKNMKC